MRICVLSTGEFVGWVGSRRCSFLSGTCAVFFLVRDLVLIPSFRNEKVKNEEKIREWIGESTKYKARCNERPISQAHLSGPITQADVVSMEWCFGCAPSFTAILYMDIYLYKRFESYKLRLLQVRYEDLLVQRFFILQNSA